MVETDVDLRKLPILTTWPDDGGPYITLPMVITRDPDKGTRNVGCYRMQVYDRRDHRHALAAAQDRAPPHAPLQRARHQRMPVAVALGGDPVLTYAATAPLPDGIDEFMFAGLPAPASRSRW